MIARRKSMQRTGFALPKMRPWRGARTPADRLEVSAPYVTGMPKRRTALPRVSKDRAKRARVHRRQYGEPAFEAWIHQQPCQLAGVAIAVQPGESGARCRQYPDRPGIEAAHIRTRGAGHGVTVDGRANVLSLCPGHHDWQGRRTVARVQREAGVDLWALAARQAAAYLAETGGAHD